jgi:hypothetical protein
MDKFIYAVSNSNSKEIHHIYAKNFKDAQDRIIQNYWDKYDDLEEEKWENFINELWKKHSVLITKDLKEFDEL